MKVSTTVNRVAVICFWLLAWQLISMAVGSPLLLSSPVEVVGRLLDMIASLSFWATLLNSFIKILTGFMLGLTVGTVLALVCYKSGSLYSFIYPLIYVIKAIPVASFIVLALVWVTSAYLSIVTAFLIVLPVIFENIYSGFKSVDRGMLEMTSVFGVPLSKRIRYLYSDSLLPCFMSAVSIGIGFCFKAGVAAEIIGICKNTIGEAIYTAKITLETADVLAWTVVIVVISIVTQKLASGIVNAVMRRNGYDKI